MDVQYTEPVPITFKDFANRIPPILDGALARMVEPVKEGRAIVGLKISDFKDRFEDGRGIGYETENSRTYTLRELAPYISN